jgi:hypothetical protein
VPRHPRQSPLWLPVPPHGRHSNVREPEPLHAKQVPYSLIGLIAFLAITDGRQLSRAFLSRLLSPKKKPNTPIGYPPLLSRSL